MVTVVMGPCGHCGRSTWAVEVTAIIALEFTATELTFQNPLLQPSLVSWGYTLDLVGSGLGMRMG
jgi:hypothetical protein